MFWKYENWRARGHRVKTHKADCPFCKNGNGLSTGTRPANGIWHGPFDTYEMALAKAFATDAKPSVCKNCLHDFIQIASQN
jgi:hypothetical protein